MFAESYKNLPRTKQWRMLLIYNIYRLVSIGVLFGIFWLDDYRHLIPTIYFSALLVYTIFGVLFIYIWYKEILKFERQVLLSGTIDIIVMALFIHAVGYAQSGLGALLYAYIAVLSVLAPGHLPIFFAAIASCMLLILSTVGYISGAHDVSLFFFSGIYGTGFFATALTAWYLASWVRSSEQLAQARGKELASIHKLNEYIVERMQYGVIYVDANKKVRVMNTAARHFFNIKKLDKELTLQDISAVLFEKYLQFLSKKSKGSQSAQTIIEKPYLQVSFFSGSSSAQAAVLIILDDMTHIAQQAQQLKLASLGRFSASIAHELRNPLGAISHAVQLMGEGNILNEEDTHLKQLIINNCNRMNMVIKNVLQMSRRQDSKLESINIHIFLTQFKHDFCQTNSCEIVLKLPRNKNKSIVFDKSQLEQILIILCENAAIHGKDSQGNIKITLIVKSKGRKTMLLVCDAGPGIPKTIRNNIFDPFFSTLRTGFGMGLFIAKDLCEINHAQLSYLENAEGACFAISVSHGDEIEL